MRRAVAGKTGDQKISDADSAAFARLFTPPPTPPQASAVPDVSTKSSKPEKVGAGWRRGGGGPRWRGGVTRPFTGFDRPRAACHVASRTTGLIEAVGAGSKGTKASGSASESHAGPGESAEAAFLFFVAAASTRRRTRKDTPPSPRHVCAWLTQRASSPPPHPTQSFSLHIGGDLHLPTRKTERPAVTAATSTPVRDPFDGVPLRAWAERLGARVMPAYEAVKAEDARRKAAAKAGAADAAAAPLAAPIVPTFLPFTRWAASSPAIQSTLVAEDVATRPKARLSWYHPDDTMVPRGWFTGGLLADLAYYRPFRAPVAPAKAA